MYTKLDIHQAIAEHYRGTAPRFREKLEEQVWKDPSFTRIQGHLVKALNKATTQFDQNETYTLDEVKDVLKSPIIGLPEASADQLAKYMIEHDPPFVKSVIIRRRRPHA